MIQVNLIAYYYNLFCSLFRFFILWKELIQIFKNVNGKANNDLACTHDEHFICEQ